MIEYKDNCLIMPYWQFTLRFPDVLAHCIDSGLPAQELLQDGRYTVVLHLNGACHPETIDFLLPDGSEPI